MGERIRTVRVDYKNLSPLINNGGNLTGAVCEITQEALRSLEYNKIPLEEIRPGNKSITFQVGDSQIKKS